MHWSIISENIFTAILFQYLQYTNQGFRLPSLKSAWNLVYIGQNRDSRENVRNLIGRLEDWGLEKTDFSRKIKTPD